MRLTLLVDLDGVLADFEKRRYDVLRARGLPALHPVDVHDFYGTASYEARFGAAARRAARAVTVEPGFFRSMEPVPGALEGVRVLVRMGHDVRICSKPLDEHPACTEEKRAWVREHLGPEWEAQALIVKVKSRYPAHALIDDRPDLRSYTEARGEPPIPWRHVLFRQPWNRASRDHDFEMVDWSDFRWVDALLRTAS